MSEESQRLRELAELLRQAVEEVKAIKAALRGEAR